MYYLLTMCEACGISQAVLSPFDFVDTEKLASSPYPCPKCHQHSQVRYGQAESPNEMLELAKGTELVSCAFAVPVPKNTQQHLPEQQEDNSWMNF